MYTTKYVVVCAAAVSMFSTSVGCHSASDLSNNRGSRDKEPTLIIRDDKIIKSLGKKVEVTIEVELECNDATLVPKIATGLFLRDKVSFGEFISTPLKRVDNTDNLYRATLTLLSPSSTGKYKFSTQVVLIGSEKIVKSKAVDVEVK